MSRMNRAEFFQGKSGLWYWRLVAPNGKVVSDGAEGYASRRNVQRAIRRVTLPGTKVVEVETSGRAAARS